MPSSTVITPSLPTFSMALAMSSPIERSELAEIVATWAISVRLLQGRARRCSSATSAMTAWSMPRFRSIGFIPDATYFMPSVTMPCASTMAVVVPSPATSEVLLATSLTICTPMFSNGSRSSSSRATTTPELMMAGAPKGRSSTTVRAFGPSVTRTACARVSMPARILAWASLWKSSCLAAMFRVPK